PLVMLLGQHNESVTKHNLFIGKLNIGSITCYGRDGMNQENKSLSTAENLSVDLDAEIRKSIARIKLHIHLLLRKILRL
ncbi:MAG: hypothetical protein LZF61_06620, partial [Nitrosomonas sp.]